MLVLEKNEQNFVMKIKSTCLGFVLHVHVQWVTLSPVPGGGAMSQSLNGSVL